MKFLKDVFKIVGFIIICVGILLTLQFGIRTLPSENINSSYPIPGTSEPFANEDIADNDNIEELCNSGIVDLPTIVPVSPIDPVLRRPADHGMIFETSISPLPRPTYVFVNHWLRNGEQNSVAVYAGAQQLDTLNGGKLLAEPLPGVLLVRDFTGGNRTEKIYPTPTMHGPVRIVDVIKNQIMLAAADGSVSFFDLTTRSFFEDPQRPSFDRSVGRGSIIESGELAHIPLENANDYEFWNRWESERPDRSLIVYAGRKIDPTNSIEDLPGVVMVVDMATDKNEAAATMNFFEAPLNGTLRIVDANDSELTLATETGDALVFDVITLEFSIPTVLRNQSRGSTMEPYALLVPTSRPTPTRMATPVSAYP